MDGFNLMTTSFPKTITSTWSSGEGLAKINDGDIDTCATATVGWSGGSESQLSRLYTVEFAAPITVHGVVIKSGSTANIGGGNWGGADTSWYVNDVFQSTFSVRTIATMTDETLRTGVTKIHFSVRSGADWKDGYHSATVYAYECQIWTADDSYGAMI